MGEWLLCSISKTSGKDESMKRQIFGRKHGSKGEYELLISSDGASSGGSKADTEKLFKFELENTRRSVKALRDKAVEGYVLFEGDSARYTFTPDVDFVYPAIN